MHTSPVVEHALKCSVMWQRRLLSRCRAGPMPASWTGVTLQLALLWLLIICQEPLCTSAHMSLWQGRAHGTIKHGADSHTMHAPRGRGLKTDDSKDSYDRLVAASSRVGGRVQKQASMAVWKYDKSAFSIEPFEEWLRNTTLGSASSLSTPPMSYVCGIFVNDPYKIIFVRNRKAASSSTMNALQRAGLCSGSKKGGKCMHKLRPDELSAQGVDLNKMWQDYTVISNVRNPWARAASGYDYSHSLWPRADATRGCMQPSFEEFSRDPMVMGRLANMLNCAVNRTTSKGRGDYWNHDFYHIEPAFHCLFEDGKPVVDYLVRYERLDEDVEGMVRYVNERLPTGVPALTPPKRVPWQKKGESLRSAVQGRPEEGGGDSLTVHAHKYRSCQRPCIDNLAKFYEQDIKLLGFPAFET